MKNSKINYLTNLIQWFLIKKIDKGRFSTTEKTIYKLFNLTKRSFSVSQQLLSSNKIISLRFRYSTNFSFKCLSFIFCSKYFLRSLSLDWSFRNSSKWAIVRDFIFSQNLSNKHDGYSFESIFLLNKIWRLIIVSCWSTKDWYFLK